MLNSFTGCVMFSLLCISDFPKLNTKCRLSIFSSSWHPLLSFQNPSTTSERRVSANVWQPSASHVRLSGRVGRDRVGSKSRLFEPSLWSFTWSCCSSLSCSPPGPACVRCRSRCRWFTHSRGISDCVDVGPVMREQEEEVTTLRDSHSASKTSPPGSSRNVNKRSFSLYFLTFF